MNLPLNPFALDPSPVLGPDFGLSGWPSDGWPLDGQTEFMDPPHSAPAPAAPPLPREPHGRPQRA